MMSNVKILAGATHPPEPEYDVDIIILSLDRTDDTLAAIQSALNQDGVSFHLTVLDQGSSAESLKALVERFSTDARISILQANQNYGVAGGRNIASAFGHGRIIVALDNDAEFADRKHLSRTLEVFDQDSSLAAVGFRIVVHATGRDDLSSWGYPATLIPKSTEVFPTTTFVGAGHAIRRQAWETVGGYDPSLFFCWEEYDFCLRAITKGWKISYHGDLVVHHKVAPEWRFSWNGTRWFYFVRNRLYIAKKSREPLPSIVLRTMAYMAKGARNGILGQTLRAIPAAWKMGRNAPSIYLSERDRDYIHQHDIAHRGTVLERISREILARLPGAR